MRHRLVAIVLVAAVSTLLIFTVFQGISWRSLPQKIGLGEQYGEIEEQTQTVKDILPEIKQAEEYVKAGTLQEGKGGKWSGDGTFREPKVEATSPYPMGHTKPPGSNYTKTLIMPKMSHEDTDWIERELHDLIEPGLVKTAIYHMDDPSAELHPIENKGNEAMAYLSYIIDSYDSLSDVSIFMHSHQTAKHNNDLLDRDASLMIRHLSPERVWRDGYMNMRCHWSPGCPDWMHPGAATKVFERPEEYYLANSWAELFPEDQIPSILAQPCCAQFAVSRDRIRALPKSRYLSLRDWLVDTNLGSAISGRVFEYAWQYLFAGTPVHCPSMSACYCDGYGLCFGDPEQFDRYFEMRFHFKDYQEELRLWDEKAERLEEAREHAKGGKLSGDEELEIPKVGRGEWLRDEIERLDFDMGALREEALERGRDPRQRAKEAGREWKEGDGF